MWATKLLLMNVVSYNPDVDAMRAKYILKKNLFMTGFTYDTITFGLTYSSIIYMEKIRLDIVALSHSVTQSHNYAVVLGEQGGPRRLPIVIGGFEAQAIAVALENMSPNRPLTHDLFRNALQAFDIELKEVVINNLIDGIFYAQLICQKNGELIEVDSRTSDAIAMAVRFECPIYTFEFIMESAGVIQEDDQLQEPGAQVVEPTPAKKKRKSLADQDTATLQKMMDKAIAAEEYEKAARIRDELNSRDSN